MQANPYPSAIVALAVLCALLFVRIMDRHLPRPQPVVLQAGSGPCAEVPR
jgi:hypothetical protein